MKNTPRAPVSIIDDDVLFYSDLFDHNESEKIFSELLSAVKWDQKQVEIATGIVKLPRLIAWYADDGITYTYSGLTLNPEPWITPLLEIKHRIEETVEYVFNSLLLHLYRNQEDSVSWHSDDEPELGPHPIIASVSFGAARVFQFKHKINPEKQISIELTPGSLLLMRGDSQSSWKHRLPKLKKPCDARINLTFRKIIS